MSKYLIEKYKNLKEFTPGEQVDGSKFIKLNTNENPYPPAPGSVEAVTQEVENLGYYNDPLCVKLRETFAGYHGISPDQVMFGNGSDEILAFSFFAFGDEKQGMCFPDITYGFYEVYSELFGLKGKQIPLNDDLSITPSDYFHAGSTIIIANPNAPSGLVLSLDEIKSILNHNPNHVVIIDEAYISFGGETAMTLIDTYDNLLVVGTFSKERNLAGARLGYAVAHPDLIADMNKIRYSFNPYDVNAMTQALGCISIQQEEYFKECVGNIIGTRNKFTLDLRNIGFEVADSNTNFVFAKPTTMDAKVLYNKLKERNILVRHFPGEKVKNHIRISIGTQEQMDTVIEHLKEILAE